MSGTKHFLETNADWDETLGRWIFKDGYGAKPPRKILLRRLQKAGMLKDDNKELLEETDEDWNGIEPPTHGDWGDY